MSPEQTRGHPVDKRADIWAFGAMLFEMLAGRRAFEGDTVADTFARILEYEPDWTALPADTPAPIRRLLERCLQKDLRKRMRDISDAVLEIDEAMYGRAGAPLPLTVPARVVRPERRRKVRWVIAGTLTVAVVAAAAFLWTTRNDGTIVEPALIRLTSNTPDMFVTSAHIAPDGRHLAFVDRYGPAGSVY